MPRLATALFSLAIFVLALPACVRDRRAHAAGPLPRDVIVVVGEGEVMGKPDVARLQLGVEARARDAAAAVTAINEKAARMIETLKQLGIASEDLQTRDFNISSEHFEGPPEPLPPVEPAAPASAAPASQPKMATAASGSDVATGGDVATEEIEPHRRRPLAILYRASNTVHVTVRDLDKLGEVLSRAVEAGANSAWGISFEIDDDEPLVEKARAEAVADAREQATELAKLAGVTLGPVVSILEAGGGGVAPPMPVRGYGYAMEVQSVPTERGQLAVQRQVQVVFAIEPPR
jgi:uncharacterized protein YggE